MEILSPQKAVLDFRDSSNYRQFEDLCPKVRGGGDSEIILGLIELLDKQVSKMRKKFTGPDLNLLEQLLWEECKCYRLRSVLTKGVNFQNKQCKHQGCCL